MSQYSARVGLTHGDDRRANVRTALDSVRDEITAKIADPVLVKPNFLSSKNQIASSHVDALRGILDFLMSVPQRPGAVIVAEGANEDHSGQAFENFGYHAVIDEYPFEIQLLDLHHTTDWVEMPVYQYDRTTEIVRIPSLVAESPCTISLAVAKTHDACVVTLAQKNLIMGTMHLKDRIKMHGCQTHGDRELKDEVCFLNMNLARLSTLVRPDIAVIDGTVGLQGNGPGGTDAVDFGVVAASADVFAADAVMAKAMGFDPARLAQSWYGNLLKLGVSDLESIEVVGADLDAVTVPFKPHETTEKQWKWSRPDLVQYLAA